jgi:hypothetical protein
MLPLPSRAEGLQHYWTGSKAQGSQAESYDLQPIVSILDYIYPCFGMCAD